MIQFNPAPLHLRLERYTLLTPGYKLLARFKTESGVSIYLLNHWREFEKFDPAWFYQTLYGLRHGVGSATLEFTTGQLLIHTSWLNQQAHNCVHGFKFESTDAVLNHESFKELCEWVKGAKNEPVRSNH